MKCMAPSRFSIFVLFLRNNVQRSRFRACRFYVIFFLQDVGRRVTDDRRDCLRPSSFGRLLTLAFYSRQRFAITGRKKRRKKRRADEPSEP